MERRRAGGGSLMAVGSFLSDHRLSMGMVVCNTKASNMAFQWRCLSCWRALFRPRDGDLSTFASHAKIIQIDRRPR